MQRTTCVRSLIVHIKSCTGALLKQPSFRKANTQTLDFLINTDLNFTGRTSPKLVSESEQFFSFNTENSPYHKGSHSSSCPLYHNHRVCKHQWRKDPHQCVGKSNPYIAHSSFLHQRKVMHYDFQFIKISCIIQN